MHLIDTNIAIFLRDSNAEIATRVNDLPTAPALSLLTHIELEGGIGTVPAAVAARRRHTDVLLAELDILPLDRSVVDEYGRIVAACGFSRRLVLDRLIAATAIVNDLTLITINPADFRGIPNLRLESWPAPAQ